MDCPHRMCSCNTLRVEWFAAPSARLLSQLHTANAAVCWLWLDVHSCAEVIHRPSSASPLSTSLTTRPSRVGPQSLTKPVSVAAVKRLHESYQGKIQLQNTQPPKGHFQPEQSKVIAKLYNTYQAQLQRAVVVDGLLKDASMLVKAESARVWLWRAHQN